MPTTRIKREQESQGLRAKAPLAAQFEDCLQSLRQLSDALHANRPDSAELEDLARHCSLRLKGWGADSGASSRALDYALRSSSSLMGQTCRLLTDLHLTLAQAIAQVRPQALENDEPGEPSGIPQWEISKISESGAVSNEEEADEDTSMCLDEALDIVACLFQLLPALVDPQHEDDPAELVTKDPSDHSLQLYVDLADKLFPNAPSNLRARLVESTWRARRNLRLLKQRADNQPDLSGAPRSTANLAMPRRIRRPGPRRRGHEQNSVHQRSTLANSEAGTSTARSFSETIMSKTQFPDQSSMSSLTDSQPPTLVQQMIPRLTVPEFKTVLGDNDQFDCPLCYFELPLTMDAANMDQKEWTDHMFHDLQPYLCTFDECSRDNRPFATKDEWFQHELDFHRSQMVWFCGACGDYTDTEDKFRSHLRSMHKAFEPEVLSSIAEGCRRYARTPSNLQECILCQTVLSGLDNLKDHIAAHLEQFSIAASLDLEQSDEDGLEVDDFVDEYVTEQAELHGNTLGPSGTDAQTIQGVEAINHIGTDASRAIDTSDASNNDDMNPATRRQRDDLWNEKVKSFLDKQASVDQVHQTEQCNVPERDEHFFGRQETLRRMHEVMSAPGYVCVVGGRGGIGKTSVALEYLYRHQAAYAYTFWVDAESPGHCAEKYARIASVLDTGNTALPEENSRVYFVRECLTRTERRWLLVFDNVTSWSDIARFIPRNMARSKGSILITTREGPLLAVPHAYHQKTIELEVLSLDSSREFLLVSLQPKLTKEELRCHEEFELAAQVVNLVGCLPLAVSILVGYVKVSRCTLADFLEMWEEKESRKKNRKKAVTLDSTGIDPTIDSLWEIGIREVQLNCRRLLDVLSFLDPECIQKSLLVGDHKEQYLEFLNESETVSYGRMIKQLNGRRLITVREAEDGEPLYSIHRMLQQKIQLDMEDYGFADAFRKAFHLIRKRYPRADATQVPDPEAWTVCKKYMPHVYSFHRIYKETPQAADLKEPRPEKVAELFYDAGFHVWARQTTGYDGISFLETADEILNRIGYDPDAKLRADIGTVWGLLLNNLGAGDRAQGMERLKRVKQIREKIWAEDPTLENDIMLRNAANDYSLYLLNQHHFEEAAKIIEECYKQYQVWGPESENPFEYSKYWGNYSVVLMWRGEIDEAIQYVERCIQLTGKFSGKNPQYYRREFLLGCYLLQKGDVQGALDKHMATLTARLELHGQNHEATILSMYAVGAMYHHLGDASTAIEYLKQCIDCEKRAKWTREGLALAKYRLSLLYEEQGIEDEQAKTLKAEARKVLDDCGEYAGICARQSGDEMSILEDLQPTFTGRYTGQALLKTIQHYHSSERIVVDA